MSENTTPRFVCETQRQCRDCGRMRDAVRQVGESGLLVSRHLARGRDGFCTGSLAEAPR